jgi:branched-chain amino acid transport system ATP-binding protein
LIASALEFFPVLAERRHQYARTLSGGEQRMLSLALALAVNTRLLIADELSLGLAPRLVEQVFHGLVQARRRGLAIILVEQYVHLALDIADECLILQRGVVSWNGTASEAKRVDVLERYI